MVTRRGSDIHVYFHLPGRGGADLVVLTRSTSVPCHGAMFNLNPRSVVLQGEVQL